MPKEKFLNASKLKNDEYYTLYEDISAEVSRYASQLKGKRILCPCDWDDSYNEEVVYKGKEYVQADNFIETTEAIKKINVQASKNKIIKDINLVKCNFVKFLIAHAENYGIKSISVSGYNPLKNEGVKFQDIDYSNYDVVITNPPFSLFRKFIGIMFSNNMKFLVIGPQTAITYKEAFYYIKNNKMWLGYSKQISGFMLSDGTRIMSKNKEGSVPRACKWFTNLDVSYRHDKLILTEKYNPEKYQNYYNYNGINVDRVADIPYDYDGIMGAPITFLTKYNPNQFEIIDKGVTAKKTVRFPGDKAALWIEKDGQPDRAPFERILIKNKEPYFDED